MNNSTHSRKQQKKLHNFTTEHFTVIGIITMIVITVAVFINTYLNFRQYSLESMEAYTIQATLNYVTSIEDSYKTMQDVGKFTNISIHAALKSSDNYEDFIKRTLEEILTQYTFINGIKIIYEGEEGFKTTALSYNKGDFLYTKVDDTFLNTVYKKDRIRPVSKVSGIDENGFISLHFPIWDEHFNCNGLIYVYVPASYFQVLNSIAGLSDTDTYIIDSNLRIIANESTNKKMMNITSIDEIVPLSLRENLLPMIHANLERGEITHKMIYNPYRNEDCWFLCYPIDNLDGTFGSFVTIVPKNIIFKKLYGTGNFLVGSLLLILILLAMLQYGAILRARTFKDGLTGIYNRLYLDKKLPENVKTCSAKNRPLSLVLCDVDHFKKINDTYGHLIGDEVLKYVCHLLYHHIRKQDWIARYGGEEFVICLPYTDITDTIAIAERLRNTLEQHPFIKGDVLIPVTMSFGISCTTGTYVGMTDIIKRADENLYRAKESGRNVVVY